MSMARALGEAGPGFQLEWRGQRYTFVPPTLKMEAAFAEWVKATARKELAALAEVLRPEVFAVTAARFAILAKSEFAITSARVQAARNDPDGMAEYLLLMLAPNHPKVTVEDVKLMMLEEAAQISLMLKDFFQQGVEDATPAPTTTTVTSTPTNVLT